MKPLIMYLSFQFAAMLEDNANSKIDTTTEQAFANKDNARKFVILFLLSNLYEKKIGIVCAGTIDIHLSRTIILF